MKKLIKTIVFLGSLLLLLTSSSCDNDDIETGVESFSCYINGQLFVPKARPLSFTTSPLSKKLIFNRGSYFSVKARDHENYTIFFTIRNFEDNDSHFLKFNDSSNGDINHAQVRTIINGENYLSKENSGTVTFTEVSDANVAGTFEFTLYNENDETDIIKVTKGKFND
jgi:hypothetical protein